MKKRKMGKGEMRKEESEWIYEMEKEEEERRSTQKVGQDSWSQKEKRVLLECLRERNDGKYCREMLKRVN